MVDEELKQKLATCGRILNRLGLFGIYGHISARVPGEDRFYITATLGSTSLEQELTPEGMVLCDASGKKISGNGTVPLEVVLHVVLHKAREDAGCVVHIHPFYSMALAIAGLPFVPVTVQGAPLAKVPVYRKAELLIDDAQGKKLLRAMGKARAILLRGHGVVVLGETIEEATCNTVYVEENCKYLLTAAAAGGVIPVTKAELKERADQVAASAGKGNPHKRVFDLLDRKTR